MLLAFLVIAVVGWWAQRDSYRQGIEYGRALERQEQYTRELAKRGEHLRVVR